jgi:hypothetical protein
MLMGIDGDGCHFTMGATARVAEFGAIRAGVAIIILTQSE